MKKFLSLVSIMIVIAIVLAILFVIGVRNGYLVADAYIHLSGDCSQSEHVPDNDNSFTDSIKNELRNSEKTDFVPGSDYLQLKACVQYYPNINISYILYLNPYDETAYIDKGFFTPSFYTMSQDMVKLLCCVGDTIVHMPNGENFTLNNKEFRNLLDSINVANPLSIDIQDMDMFQINSTLNSGLDLDIMIVFDSEDDNLYAITQGNTYSIDDEFANLFLSKDPVFETYIKSERPIPRFKLTSATSLFPEEIKGEWTFVKPSGETQTQNIFDKFAAIFHAIEPGVSFSYEVDGRLPDSLILTEIINGLNTNKFNLFENDYIVPDLNGPVQYVLEATYDADEDFLDYGTISKKYLFEVNLPAQSRKIYDEVRPGDALAFFIDFAKDDETFEIETNLSGFSGNFSPYKDKMIIYVPVNWWTPPGQYFAKVYKNVNDVRELMQEYPITILPDNFEVSNQQLVVSEKLAEKASAESSAYDSKRVSAAKSTTNPTSLLDGPFIMPLNGALGTSFGRTRYINWKNPYRHSGLDIDGDIGDHIVAGNNGIIVLAEELIRCGNTVIIDHGMGLFSSYLHMSKIGVSVGDFVKKGDFIGEVGSTGFSTGPHLHWAATLNGNYISPLWLVDNPLVPE